MRHGYIESISLSDYYHLFAYQTFSNIKLNTSNLSSYLLSDSHFSKYLQWMKKYSNLSIELIDPFNMTDQPTTITIQLTKGKWFWEKSRLLIRPTIKEDIDVKIQSKQSNEVKDIHYQFMVVPYKLTFGELSNHLHKLYQSKTSYLELIPPVVANFYCTSRPVLTEEQKLIVKLFNEKKKIKFEEKENEDDGIIKNIQNTKDKLITGNLV